LRAIYPEGAALFAAVCQTCHGEKGNGIASLGPPLNNSEWVTEDTKRLISLVLYGLSGPIEVNGKLYESGQMPGIAHDKSISNEEVAQLLSYIRNSWNNNAEEVHVEEVEGIRQKFQDRNSSFTVEEINKIFQKD
jgi:mono/diheme cytochrome c family protein